MSISKCLKVFQCVPKNLKVSKGVIKDLIRNWYRPSKGVDVSLAVLNQISKIIWKFHFVTLASEGEQIKARKVIQKDKWGIARSFC